MKQLAKKAVRLILIPLLFCAALLGITWTAKTASAEERSEVKTVYDVEKEYPGATGDYVAVSGSGGPQWYFQALNTAAYHTYLQFDEDGVLTTNTGNSTLQLWPMVRNGNQGDGLSTEMKDGSGYKNLDYLVQYPAGYGVAYTDADVDYATYTASAQFCNFYGGQWVHPGLNLAPVYSFKVPRSGSVYLKDIIRVSAGSADGVRLGVYLQPKEYASVSTVGGVWGGLECFSLYGSHAVYPTPNVPMQYSGEGWQIIPAGSNFQFITDNFDVEEGDMIHFILDANGSINSDQTFFAPKVVYGQRPDELILSKEEVTLAAPANEGEAGETCKLVATVRPASSADKRVTFATGNDKVATVDEDGTVTAVGVGTALITATVENGVSEDGNPVTAVCTVTVVPPYDSIGIIQSNSELLIEQAYTLQLQYEILPPSSSGKNVVWSIVSQSPETEGQEVISLSATGLVTAKYAGTATVRIEIEDSDAYCERIVTVTSAPNPTLSVSQTSVNIVAGNTAGITTSVTPLFHANDEVTVVSSDEEIVNAEWDNGTVLLLSKNPGTATLTLSVRDGNSVVITVNVLAQSDKVYSWRSAFRAEQGSEWYYYFLKEGDENYTELVYSASEWGAYEENTAQMLQSGGFVPKAADFVPEAGAVGGAYNQYLLLWQGQFIHPGNGYNGVLGFRAPLTGTLDFMSYFRIYDSRSDGVRIRILKGEEQIYPVAGRQLVSFGNPVEAAVCNIKVTAGDMFYIIVDCNEENVLDSCYLNPEFCYTDYEAIPDRIEISKANVSASVGKEILLTATVISSGNTDQKIEWRSSDESIATVNRFGIVTAVGTGTVTITAELPDGTKSECLVTVAPDEEKGVVSGGLQDWEIALIASASVVAVASGVGIGIGVARKKKNNRKAENNENGLDKNNEEDQGEDQNE